MLGLLSDYWHPSIALYLVPAAVFLAHAVPYFVDPHRIRQYPGPFIAKFSDIWLGLVAKHGHRSEEVHKQHQKHGMTLCSLALHEVTDTECRAFRPHRLVLLLVTSTSLLRCPSIAPNHISVADPDALSIVYAHGNGALKSEFYDAFVSIRRGVFNTRDRTDHTRKRKIISHIFSQKSVVEFEPQVRLYVGMLLKQWDRLFDMALKGMSGPEGDGGWRGEGGRLWLDCLPCV
jgi:benzoate 4-monooxygenase